MKAQKREKKEAQDQNLMMEGVDKLTTDVSAINDILLDAYKSINHGLGQNVDFMLLQILPKKSSEYRNILRMF